MGIISDGDRSRKLMWFAKKLIRKLRMLDMPSGMLKYNGFTIKAWVMGGLSGGRITAPMGIVVAHCCINGVSIMTADNWEGGFDGRKYFRVLFKNVSSGNILNFFDRVPAQDVSDAGFTTIQFVPFATQSPYYNLPGGYYNPATTLYFPDALPTPVVVPVFTSESFWTNITGTRFVDDNGDGIPDSDSEATQESSMTFYSSDGSNLGGRRTMSMESSYPVGSPEETLATASRTLMLMPSAELSVVLFQYVFYNDHDGIRHTALMYNLKKDLVSYGFFSLSDAVSGMPSGLISAIESPGGGLVSTIQPLGNYAFSTGVDVLPTLLHGIDLINAWPTLANSSEDDWFDSNPSLEYWRLSYCIQQFGGTVYSVASDNFMPLLDHMASLTTLTPSSNWKDARDTFQQLFPRPNNNHTVPYDSVMFHAGDTNVYVWTRKYNSTNLGTFGGDTFNAFKFSRTGITVTELIIPTIVTTTDGIRPSITYAGNDLYLCVCEGLETPLRVHEIHVGSPFTGWTEIPVAVGTDELIHVRPVRVKTGDIVLLGIIEDVEGLYYFAILRYINSVGEWVRMGKIPAIRPTVFPNGNPYPYPDDSNWSIALFGEGEYAREISQYMSPPYASGQMPVGPYAGYAGGQP